MSQTIASIGRACEATARRAVRRTVVAMLLVGRRWRLRVSRRRADRRALPALQGAACPRATRCSCAAPTAAARKLRSSSPTPTSPKCKKIMSAKRTATPAGEREATKAALAWMGHRADTAVGTAGDRPGDDLAGNGDPGQMDCVDVATNLSSYMLVMERHKTLPPSQRRIDLREGGHPARLERVDPLRRRSRREQDRSRSTPSTAGCWPAASRRRSSRSRGGTSTTTTSCSAPRRRSTTASAPAARRGRARPGA